MKFLKLIFIFVSIWSLFGPCDSAVWQSYEKIFHLFNFPSKQQVPINQMTINQVYCEKDLPLLDCAGKATRKNKTAQLVTGYILFKEDYDTDISTTFHIYTQDHAIWKHFTQRTLNDTCNMYFSEDGKAADQRKRFFPTIPDGCPVKSGNYTIGPAFVNRYRKDWEPDLKFFIPPMLQEADNWKLVGEFFRGDDDKTIIGKITMEFRLFNEYMSQ